MTELTRISPHTTIEQDTDGTVWRPGNGCEDRTFMDHVKQMSDVDDETGCWNWKGSKTGSGYALYFRKRKKLRVSRAILGIIDDDSVFACHRCDNPSCVNPGHLFIGTRSDNMRDAFQKGRLNVRIAVGEMSRTAKLSDADAVEIARRCAGGESQTCVAADYHISQATVSDIVCGKTWKHTDALRLYLAAVEKEMKG